VKLLKYRYAANSRRQELPPPAARRAARSDGSSLCWSLHPLYCFFLPCSLVGSQFTICKVFAGSAVIPEKSRISSHRGGSRSNGRRWRHDLHARRRELLMRRVLRRSRLQLSGVASFLDSVVVTALSAATGFRSIGRATADRLGREVPWRLSSREAICMAHGTRGRERVAAASTPQCGRGMR